MPKIPKPLNPTQVKNAKPRSKEYNLADGGGLYLRVMPHGSKVWLFQFSAPYTKRRTNISLGKFPVVSLKSAREKRDAYRELIADNIDPREHRRKCQEEQNEALSSTLITVSERWLSVKRTQVTSNYADDLERALQNHVFPRLGKLPIHLITAPQAIETLKPLERAGKLESVKRLCITLNQVMDFAVNVGLIESNRLSGIRAAFSAPTRQHLASIKPEELPALLNQINTANIRITTKCLLLWQLHTMTRPSEAAGATWEEIDLKNKVWTIPASRMKRRKEHKVPMTPQAIEILDTMKPISGRRDYVFPADRNPRQPTNSQNTNMALKRMGYKGKLVAHGLRSLASTILNEEGFDPDLIELALAHVDKNQVRAAYNRAEYMKRRGEMMEWWSNRIQEYS